MDIYLIQKQRKWSIRNIHYMYVLWWGPTDVFSNKTKHQTYKPDRRGQNIDGKQSKYCLSLIPFWHSPTVIYDYCSLSYLKSIKNIWICMTLGKIDGVYCKMTFGTLFFSCNPHQTCLNRMWFVFQSIPVVNHLKDRLVFHLELSDGLPNVSECLTSFILHEYKIAQIAKYSLFKHVLVKTKINILDPPMQS